MRTFINLKTNIMSIEKFRDYVTSLGLEIAYIGETNHSFEVMISLGIPSIEDFTQISRGDRGRTIARLSKGDIQNPSITKGFFNKGMPSFGTTDLNVNQRAYIRYLCRRYGNPVKDMSGELSGAMYVLFDVFVGDFTPLDFQRGDVEEMSGEQFVKRLMETLDIK